MFQQNSLLFHYKMVFLLKHYMILTAVLTQRINSQEFFLVKKILSNIIIYKINTNRWRRIEDGSSQAIY
jgi:hypothetical protein